MYRAAKPETNLKMRRLAVGLRQRRLAELSGIPLRTIQQYEQCQKNINRAATEYIAMLAKVLRCDEKIEKKGSLACLRLPFLCGRASICADINKYPTLRQEDS